MLEYIVTIATALGSACGLTKEIIQVIREARKVPKGSEQSGGSDEKDISSSESN